MSQALNITSHDYCREIDKDNLMSLNDCIVQWLVVHNTRNSMTLVYAYNIYIVEG